MTDNARPDRRDIPDPQRWLPRSGAVGGAFPDKIGNAAVLFVKTARRSSSSRRTGAPVAALRMLARRV
jgi:hypothetical protein